MITRTVYDSSKYKAIGARFGSAGIHKQGQDTAALWQENLPVFTDFGQGSTELAKFLNLLNQHNDTMATRPTAATPPLGSSRLH